jgi:hypothetical protein
MLSGPSNDVWGGSWRPLIDTAIVIVAGVLVLLTAYWLILIGNNFAYIYLSGAMYAAIVAYLVRVAWLKNAFIGLCSLFASLMMAEIVLFALSTDDGSNATEYVKGYSEPFRQNGGHLGSSAMPNKSVEAWKTIRQHTVYDVTYTTDASGFRVTPGIEPARLESGAYLFFGGSFTFGEGLNDDETLPYFFAKELGFRHPVINTGFSGYGPHQMLRMLELGMVEDLVNEDVRAAIYVGLPTHADRVVGNAWWDPVGPKYELDSTNNVRYSGRFTNIPEQLVPAYYRLLQVIELGQRSRIVSRTMQLLSQCRQIMTSELALLYASIVAKAAKMVEASGAKFYVLFWDDDSELSRLILEQFAKKNISIIRVSNFMTLAERASYSIPMDGHPTVTANRLLAKGLWEQVRP